MISDSVLFYLVGSGIALSVSNKLKTDADAQEVGEHVRTFRYSITALTPIPCIRIYRYM